ncbi:sodium-dependent phosphate transport protein 3 isoform X2 [Mustela nigripes]|uniref:sodium-dependent phosphate transport protein 3 isoform X2 n=1 Tax=Mustela lutreola TaxID=9666 RepID=UPI002797515C|nr:sodium-dependent phosphate transport protein 3 isoform X2 [Mustela lutreola]XP_059254942.1 sodium-dependent phosphate transport protein 3 isoform X2 [Mustela nigripes]
MDKKTSSRKGPEFCSLRYGLALIMHFSNFTMITQRVSLSIAIIAMVNSTQQHGLSNASTEGPLVDTLNNPSRSMKEFNTGASVYEWSPETQGIIFSSISYGIIVTLIPSGYLAGILGAKQMLGAGLLISSLLTLFTPLAADFGVILVIVIRTIQGMAQGMAWTGQFTIWAKWAPPLERSKLTSIAGSGAAFGSFIILCVGGLISQALGWPFIFYIFGSIGCVCCLLWFTVIYDDPMHHPCISVQEKDYIVASLAQQSGVLSSLPFIAASSCTILGGQLADFLLSRNLLRLITVRKLFSSLGLLLPSLCAVALPFVASSYVTTIILLILIPGTSNLCDSGFIINTLDVAPRYASFLMGISRGFGLIAGIISSTATGFLISQDSVSGWRNVFFLSAAVNMFGMFFYITFGQVEIQDWAREKTLTRL